MVTWFGAMACMRHQHESDTQSEGDSLSRDERSKTGTCFPRHQTQEIPVAQQLQLFLVRRNQTPSSSLVVPSTYSMFPRMRLPLGRLWLLLLAGTSLSLAARVEPSRPALDHTAQEPGWTSLFDGHTLDGWRKSGYGLWKVEDGAIVGQRESAPGIAHPGGFLFTERADFLDFELMCEVNLDFGTDSGIHLRDVSQGFTQTGDGYQATLDYRKDGPFGGFYYKAAKEVFAVWRTTWPYVIDDAANIRPNEYYTQCCGPAITPEAWRTLFKPGEWNTIRVRIEGDPPRYQFWLNGTRTVVFQANMSWNKGPGKIGFQIINDPNWKEGSRIRFRRIFVRSLP